MLVFLGNQKVLILKSLMYKNFLKNMAPVYSNKIKSKDGITLNEIENIISNDKKLLKPFTNSLIMFQKS